MVKLRKQLFWDVDVKKLDEKKHAQFIIDRVLSFGDLEDYKAIKKHYGLRKIKQVAPRINYANKKSLYFWSNIFNIPLKSFACTDKLLAKKPSAYWQR